MVCVCVCVCNWIIDDESLLPHEYNFGFWATFFVGPLLFLPALLHAGGSGDASTMTGVFQHVLCLEYGLYS